MPLPVELSVSVIKPDLISAGEGLYVGLGLVLSGKKDPVPEVVQLAPEAEVIFPFNCMEDVFAHTSWLPPEFAEGPALIFSAICLLCELQVPFPSLVSVKNILPLLISAVSGK